MKSILLLSLLVVDTCIRCIFGNVCSELVYMKIAYTEKLLDSTYPEKEVRSVKECLENCRDDAQCKSVGIQAKSMKCVMYKQRVYAGQSIAASADMVYYWQLEDECPTDLGYKEDPTTKICSKYSTTQLSWSNAQAHCEKDGGHLFLADTQAKRAVLKRYSPDVTFLGATDSQEENVWNWLNGVPVDRSQFDKNEPNNVQGSEHCLMVGLSRNYNDLPCSYKREFICEVPTKQAYSSSGY